MKSITFMEVRWSMLLRYLTSVLFNLKNEKSNGMV